MSVEDRKQKFITFAERRVSKIFHFLRLLENLSNKSNYTYDNRQMKQIVKAIDKRWEQVRTSLLTAENDKKEFTLK